MMWGYGARSADFGGFGLLSLLTWVVILIDLILLGFWLWKQIQKK